MTYGKWSAEGKVFLFNQVAYLMGEKKGIYSIPPLCHSMQCSQLCVGLLP